MFRRGQRPAVTDTDTGKRSWQILAVVLTGSFMAVLDTAHASSDALEWVVSGYALTFGLALVPAGFGDRYGSKRLFLAGLSLFTLASVACGVSRTRAS